MNRASFCASGMSYLASFPMSYSRLFNPWLTCIIKQIDSTVSEEATLMNLLGEMDHYPSGSYFLPQGLVIIASRHPHFFVIFFLSAWLLQLLSNHCYFLYTLFDPILLEPKFIFGWCCSLMELATIWLIHQGQVGAWSIFHEVNLPLWYVLTAKQLRKNDPTRNHLNV
jgi:hypothetical protein